MAKAERRPVLITAVHGDTADGLEVTHSPTYHSLSLIRTPSLEERNKESYVNVYNFDKYENLPLTYDFPIAFNSDGSPQTSDEYFGNISNKKSSKPLIVSFNSKDNFFRHISDADWKTVKKELDYFKNFKVQ